MLTWNIFYEDFVQYVVDVSLNEMLLNGSPIYAVLRSSNAVYSVIPAQTYSPRYQ